MDSQKVYQYLKLEQFTNDELNERFQLITTSSDGTVNAAIVFVVPCREEKDDDEAITTAIVKNEIFAFNQNKLQSYVKWKR